MHHVFATRNSSCIAQYTVLLFSYILRDIIIVSLEGRQNASTRLILVRDPRAFINTITQHKLLIGKYFYLGRSNFPVISIFQYGQEFTQLFMGKGVILFIIV